MKDPTDPMKAAQLSAAIRALTQAESDLRAAGQNLAAMRIGSIIRGLK